MDKFVRPPWFVLNSLNEFV